MGVECPRYPTLGNFGAHFSETHAFFTPDFDVSSRHFLGGRNLPGGGVIALLNPVLLRGPLIPFSEQTYRVHAGFFRLHRFDNFARRDDG